MPLEDWNMKEEDVPNQVLLCSATFPSALQVFASVGGLALLAEHLPLLYPEITRQAASPEATTDNNNVADIGQDWVTVESSDEFYDVSKTGRCSWLVKVSQGVRKIESY